MALFLSRFDNKVDRKGRVSVPASFRADLTSDAFAGVVAFPSPPIVLLLPSPSPRRRRTPPPLPGSRPAGVDGSSPPAHRGLCALPRLARPKVVTAQCDAPTAPPVPSLLPPVAPPSQGAFPCPPAAPGVAGPVG